MHTTGRAGKQVYVGITQTHRNLQGASLQTHTACSNNDAKKTLKEGSKFLAKYTHQCFRRMQFAREGHAHADEGTIAKRCAAQNVQLTWQKLLLVTECSTRNEEIQFWAELNEIIKIINSKGGGECGRTTHPWDLWRVAQRQQQLLTKLLNFQ